MDLSIYVYLSVDLPIYLPIYRSVVYLSIYVKLQEDYWCWSRENYYSLMT